MYQIKILLFTETFAEIIEVVKTREMWGCHWILLKVCYKNLPLYAVLYRSLVMVCVVEIIDSFSNPASFSHQQELYVQWTHASLYMWVIKIKDRLSVLLHCLIPYHSIRKWFWLHLTEMAQFHLIFFVLAVCYLIWVVSPPSSYFPLSHIKCDWFIIIFLLLSGYNALWFFASLESKFILCK